MKRNKQSFRSFTAQATNQEEKLVMLPIECVTSKAQVRKLFTHIDELAASIQAEGLHMPITVTPADASGKYTIIQGERRWRACLLAGIPTIKAIIRKAPQTEAERIIAQLTENIQRDDMTCEEIAKAVAELHRTGMSLYDISRAMGKNEDWANVYYNVSDLPEYVKTIRDEQSINDPYVLRPLKKMYEQDEDLAKEAIESAIRKQVRLTRNTVKALQRQVQSQKENRLTEDKLEPITPPTPLLPKGCRESDAIRVYCWAEMPGTKEKKFGMISTDVVSDDPNFVCLMIDNKPVVVSLTDIVIAGVKDKAESINDLL